MPTARRSAVGFTLVELLIACVILGILMAIVIPQFEGTRDGVRETAMASDLRRIRGAIDNYALRHGGSLPDTHIVEQLLGRTTKAGTVIGTDDPVITLSRATSSRPTVTSPISLRTPVQTNAPAGIGPFLRSFPQNPLNGLDTVAVVTEMPARPTATTGWIYDMQSGSFRANVHGVARCGERFYDL